MEKAAFFGAAFFIGSGPISSMTKKHLIFAP